MIRLIVNPLHPFEQLVPFDEGTAKNFTNRIKRVALAIIQTGKTKVVETSKSIFYVILRAGSGCVGGFIGGFVGGLLLEKMVVIEIALGGWTGVLLIITAKVAAIALMYFLGDRITDHLGGLELSKDFVMHLLLSGSSIFVATLFFSTNVEGAILWDLSAGEWAGLWGIVMGVTSLFLKPDDSTPLIESERNQTLINKNFCKAILINYLSTLNFDNLVSRDEKRSITRDIIEHFAITTPEAIGDFPRLMFEQLMSCNQITRNDIPDFLYPRLDDIITLQNQYRALHKLSREIDQNLRNLAGRMSAGRGHEMNWCRDMSSSAQELLAEL